MTLENKRRVGLRSWQVGHPESGASSCRAHPELGEQAQDALVQLAYVAASNKGKQLQGPP